MQSELPSYPSAQTQTHALPRFAYSRKESAEIIGVSLRTIDNYIADKTLPVSRQRGRVLITAEALHRFLKRDHPITEQVQ